MSPISFLKTLYPSLIWNIPTGEKEIFLTFDDGPTPEITAWILAELQKYDASATFFCVGDNIWRYPLEYGKILTSRHQAGNHTFHHLNGWKTKTISYISDVRQCAEFVRSRLFRPPYGRIKPSQIKALKNDFKIIMWDVLSKDYDRKTSKEKCLKKVLKNTKSGSIVVFHDSIKSAGKLKYILPRVLENFTNSGYKFKAITQDRLIHNSTPRY